MSLCVSLSSMGYGYKVRVLVNGADIGVKGGQSESKRLFSPSHEMASQMSPDMRKSLVVLKDGPDAVFTLASSAKGEGKVDRTLNLADGSVVTVKDADIKS